MTTIKGLADHTVLKLTPGQRAIGKLTTYETATVFPFGESAEWRRAMMDLGADLLQGLYQRNPKFHETDRVGNGRIINQRILQWALDQQPVIGTRITTAGDLVTSIQAAGDLFGWLVNEDTIRNLLRKQEQAQQAQAQAQGARAAAQALREAAQFLQDQSQEDDPGDQDDPLDNEAGADHEDQSDIQKSDPDRQQGGENGDKGDETAEGGDSGETADNSQSSQQGGENGDKGDETAEGGDSGETADNSQQGGGKEGQPLSEAQQRIADLLAQAVALENEAAVKQGEADKATAAGIEALEKMEKDPTKKYDFGATADHVQEKVISLDQKMKNYGFGPGDPVRRDPAQALEFLRRFGGKAQRIANVIGRCRGLSLRAARNVIPSSPISSIVGHTQDITKILPIEKMYLSQNAPASLRAIHVAQWANGGLLGNLPTNEGKTQGAFVAAVDCSGSMNGEAEILAKGLALGVIRAAINDHKDRAWAAFSFADSGRFPTVTSRNDWQRVLHWVGEFDGGGTDIGEAIEWAIIQAQELQAEGEKPDVLLLTDGEGYISNRAKLAWIAFSEKHKARLFYVPIGTKPQAGVMELGAIVIPVAILNDETAGEIANQIGRLL